METNFCVQRLEKSFQNTLLHVVMFTTILLVISGIITGLKICQFSNTCIISMGWGNHIKSYNTPFQSITKFGIKFEEVKYKISEDMTL